MWPLFVFAKISQGNVMSTNKQLEDLIAPFLQSSGYELVDTQYLREAGKMVLKVFADKEGGLKLSDCEQLSRDIGDLVDKSGIIKEAYVLEVSSPGLDRVLKKESDFVKYRGKRAKVTLFAPVEGQRHFTVIINSAANGKLSFSDIFTNKNIEVEISKIAAARLDPDISI
jgi:ribosome maturation factor RimP